MAEITYQNLIDNWQTSLAAGTDWPDATVLVWLNEAINDLSIHLPPNFSESITTIADQHVYNLDQFNRGILSVHYPTSEDPPVYLTRRSRLHPEFWNRSGYYDYQDRVRQSTATPRVWISENPPADATIIVQYTGSYGADGGVGDDVPVPNQFHHILLLFLNWRSILSKHSEEIQSPDTTTLLISQLMSNADRSMREYHEALRRAQKSITTGGYVESQWTPDKYDRIY